MSTIPTSKDLPIPKTIIDPKAIKVVDKLLEGRHESDERFTADRSERASWVAPDGDVDITKDNFAIQLGRPILAEELIRRLKAINKALLFERSINFPDMWGIYVVENRPDPISGHTPWKRHICGMPDGLIGEFHKPLVVDEEIPSKDGLSVEKSNKLEGHVPGWRQILLRLVYDGQIKPADCEKWFHVTQGRSSQRWQQTQIV